MVVDSPEARVKKCGEEEWRGTVRELISILINKFTDGGGARYGSRNAYRVRGMEGHGTEVGRCTGREDGHVSRKIYRERGWRPSVRE